MTNQSTDRPARQQVSLRDINTNTEVFQFRHFEVDQHHVDDLAAVLKNGNALDRMTLWRDPESNKLVVVDGHHRLAAYRQAGWRKKVPVAVHNCGIEQARLMALHENGKTRLPLTNDERMDAAWELVCLGLKAYSKRVIVKATGAADGTVATMRRTRKALLERDPECELPKNWWQALADLKQREQREYTDEERYEMIERKIKQLDEKIGKALGQMAAYQIEAACAVVAKRLGRRGLAHLFEDHGGGWYDFVDTDLDGDFDETDLDEDIEDEPAF